MAYRIRLESRLIEVSSAEDCNSYIIKVKSSHSFSEPPYKNPYSRFIREYNKDLNKVNNTELNELPSYPFENLKLFYYLFVASSLILIPIPLYLFFAVKSLIALSKAFKIIGNNSRLVANPFFYMVKSITPLSGFKYCELKNTNKGPPRNDVNFRINSKDFDLILKRNRKTFLVYGYQFQESYMYASRNVTFKILLISLSCVFLLGLVAGFLTLLIIYM